MTAARRVTGAALLHPRTTEAITHAVLDELATEGYGRLSMESVARRAGVGKSALYRRWRTKQDMVVAMLSELSVALAQTPDTGSLRGDLRASLGVFRDWIVDPQMRTILPDLTAEAARNPTFSRAYQAAIAAPRRAHAAAPFHRAIAREELAPDLDIELALDLISAPLYWRLSIRQVDVDDAFIETLLDHVMLALPTRPPRSSSRP